MKTRKLLEAAACFLLLASASLSQAVGQVRWGKSLVNKEVAWYGSEPALEIADSVIQFQSPQGGWPKSTNLAEPPKTPNEIPQPGSGRANSLDNDATTLPLKFLARVGHATGDSKYTEPVLRGIDYLLAAQYPNGGWPQFWPLREGYYSRITYNDNAMIQAMQVLQSVAQGDRPYSFVDAERRKAASDAVSKGIACILKTQIAQNGKLAGWCAQYDENSLEPAWARAYEPPSLSGSETVGIARFLMSIEEPNKQVVESIEGVVSWLQSVTVDGKRIDRVRDEAGRTERRLVEDAQAKPLWARFYELETNRPIFLDRDSVVRYDYEEISYERRSGYSYFGTWPAKLLESEYPAWRKKHGLP